MHLRTLLNEFKRPAEPSKTCSRNANPNKGASVVLATVLCKVVLYGSRLAVRAQSCVHITSFLGVCRSMDKVCPVLAVLWELKYKT